MRVIKRLNAPQDDSAPGIFSANYIQHQGPLQVNLGMGFMFNIWECPTCTYLEFHDFEPPALG